MGRITVVVPDEVEEKLREKLPAKRGELSKFIVRVIEEKLKEMENGSS